MKEMYDILEKDSNIWELFSKGKFYQINELSSHENNGSNFNYSQNAWKYVMEPTASKYLAQNGFKVEYPNKKKFAVCLTHDIDNIYPPLNHTLLSTLYCFRELDFKELGSQIGWKIKGKKTSPYMNFRQIMELEEKYEAKSSFYFITATEDPKRFRYNIEDIKDELELISDNGWNIGLHGGYYSYNDLDKIIAEKRKLEKFVGQKVIGFRNHYLRFNVPDSWELLSKAGFKYDTTFGYNNMIGFRNGMCHPFKPYNVNENKSIDILEIPLVIMDKPLFELATSFEDAWRYTKNLIDIVEKYNGVITVLWHNDVFNNPFRKNMGKLYEKILKYCSEKNAWITSGEDIYEWYVNI